MADSHSEGVVEMGAEMDYAEHERSYKFFVKFTEYSILLISTLLLAMAFGFFTTAGFFSSLILFVIISAVGIWFLRSR